MKNYNRKEVLLKLAKAGIQPAYSKGKKGHIAYLKRPKNGRIGIKLWGMIDFLKLNVR